MVYFDGEEYADVTAKDFVTGLKHALMASLEPYLVQDSIAGLSDYLSGANKDFQMLALKQSTIIHCNTPLKNRSHTGTLKQLMACSSQLTKTF